MLHCNGQSFLDVRVPMGMKTGSALCQCTTDILRHIMASLDINVCNYVNDIIFNHSHHNAMHEFHTLYSLLEFLGLPINPKKVCPPSRLVTCMDIYVNVDTGSLTIPQEKCLQNLDMCRDLVGKLIYLENSSTSTDVFLLPARIFVDRLLNSLH